MPCPQISVNCPQNCPAQGLRDLGRYGSKSRKFPNGTNWNVWINYCEDLRRSECDKILEKYGKIRLYILDILAESIPYSRFVYDPQSNYKAGRELRKKLCQELLNVRCPQNVKHCNQCPHFNQLLDYLRNKGILIVDCALCPLYRLNNYRGRRLAATLCLNHNTIAYLNVTPNAPIITIFPHHCGFLRRKKPYIQQRVVRQFNFSSLNGLKDAIEEILGDP